jgi:predicted Zn-dependent protease
MTQPNGNRHPQVIAGINEAINIAASGQTATATQHLARLAADFPDVASVRAYLAWFLSQNKQHNEAIEQSQQAVTLAPESEKASLVRFHVLWKAGEHIRALDEMKRFLVIRPSEEYIGLVRDWDLK